MTDVALRSPDTGSRWTAFVSHPATLWSAFVVAHFWLGFLALYSPGNPFGDVSFTYKFWVEHGLATGQWVGVDSPWVYPIVALVPMLISDLFGPALYVSTWLSMVMVMDAGAFAFLTAFGRDRRLARAAWWWLGFLVLLGSIAAGRVDSIAVPLALAGLLVLATAPRLATVLLTCAAWIKVWPAALIVAAVIVLRARRSIFWTAVVVSAFIIATVALLGGMAHVFSFITQLTGRGIEIEAPMATLWMWDAARGGGTGPSRVFYDTKILAFEVVGPGITEVGTVVTVLLAVVVIGILVVTAVLVRRGVTAVIVLPLVALSLTTAFLVFNKVGSPQYVTWLAVPLCLGLTTQLVGGGRSFRVPAVLTLVIAALTQLIYPLLFDSLWGLNVIALLILTARNVLYVTLFVWTILRLRELWISTRS